MRSQALLVGDERQEDFDRLAEAWRAEYGGDGADLDSLVEGVIREQWYLQRTERWFDELQGELAKTHPLQWTPEMHHQLALFTRYKTAAERSFARSLSQLRAVRQDRIREATTFEQVRKMIAKEARTVVREAEEERRREDSGNRKDGVTVEMRDETKQGERPREGLG